MWFGRMVTPFADTPRHEISLFAPCVTSDLVEITLEMVVHYKVEHPKLLETQPSAWKLIGTRLGYPVSLEVARCSFSAVVSERDRLRLTTLGRMKDGTVASSDIVRLIYRDYGVLIIDLFIGMPHLRYPGEPPIYPPGLSPNMPPAIGVGVSVNTGLPPYPPQY